MSRNNHVFQVLVTKGNQAPIAVDQNVTNLAPGQIGVFDFKTNLSIDGSVPTRDFYLAVGIDKSGNGITDDVVKSRGSHIQGRNNMYYTYRPHTPGAPLKVVLKDYTAQCETEYGIKLELRNQEIYRTQGYNQFTKTYSIMTSCCSGCTPTCPSGDANEITKLLKLSINSDPNGLVTAIAIARQPLLAATHGVAANVAVGAEVSDADLIAIMAFNAAQPDTTTFVYTDLEISTVTQGVNSFCDINLQYFYPRQTIAIMSKVQGFECTGMVEVTQQATFEEGAGYDIKQLEYFAKGFDESPYRVSSLNGVAKSTAYNTDETVQYDQIVLAYDQHSRNAWLEYYNDEATYLAVPAVDTITRNGVIAILDGLMTPFGFDAKADDAAAANVDPTVIEKTTDKTVQTDGIG